MIASDLQLADKQLWQQFKELYDNGNYSGALAVLENSQFDKKILGAELLNDLTAKIVQAEKMDRPDFYQDRILVQDTAPTLNKGQVWFDTGSSAEIGSVKKITLQQNNGTDYDTLYPKVRGEDIVSPVPVNQGGTGQTSGQASLNYLILSGTNQNIEKTDVIPFANWNSAYGFKTTYEDFVKQLPNVGGVIKANLLSQINALGTEVKIQSGNYEGTGAGSRSTVMRLTFNFEPIFVLVSSATRSQIPATPSANIADFPNWMVWIKGSTTLKLRYGAGVGIGTTESVNTTISGKTLSWQVGTYDSESSRIPAIIMNSSNTTYGWVAFGK